jgi:hypothetical protein
MRGAVIAVIAVIAVGAGGGVGERPNSNGGAEEGLDGSARIFL